MQRDEEQPTQVDTKQEVQENQNLTQQLNQLDNEVENKLAQLEKFEKITGSPVNNAIIVQILICTVASACTALINSITPVRWLISLIPVFNLLNFIIYATFLAFLQFGSGFFKKGPWNFLFFIIHFVGKTTFMIFYGVNYPYLKLQVFYFLCVFGYFYILTLVRNSDNGQLNVDFSVKGNFFKLVGLGAFIGVFLTLLTDAGFGPMLWQPIIAILYSFYMLLEAQRFQGSLEYLREGKNTLYLGAAQIDADLLWFCPLAIFHVSKKAQKTQNEETEKLKQQINDTLGNKQEEAKLIQQHEQNA